MVSCKVVLLWFLVAESVTGYYFSSSSAKSNDKPIPIDAKYDYKTLKDNQEDYFAVQATIIQPPDFDHSYSIRPKYHTYSPYMAKSSAPRSTCFKCPPEQILVAKKGTDGVLIRDLPIVTYCNNKAISGDVYKFQPLLPTKQFFLSQGSHSFLVKIVNSTGQDQHHTCSLKYRIMVQRCPQYTPHSRRLRMKCTLDNLWGSTCTFTCKDGGYATNQASTVYCNDHLEWEGEEPYCHYKNDHLQNDESQRSSSCEILMQPRHGKFICGPKPSLIMSEMDRLPEGSKCRVQCNRHFEVPAHLEKYSIFSCSNGHWNSTMMMDFCIRNRRKAN